MVEEARAAGNGAASCRERAVAMVTLAARRLHADPLFDRLLDVDPELLLPYVTVRLGGMQRMAVSRAGRRAARRGGRRLGAPRRSRGSRRVRSS